MNNRKYQYLQIGIASPEEIISWANPFLREEIRKGKILHYNPLRKDKMTICGPKITSQNKPSFSGLKVR